MSEITTLDLKKNGDVDVPMSVIQKIANKITLRATGSWSPSFTAWTLTFTQLFAKNVLSGFDQIAADIKQPQASITGELSHLSTCSIRFGISVKATPTERVDILKAADALLANSAFRNAILNGDAMY